MTASEFATLVDGRPVGRNRFTAKRPAHSDRSPSLSIAEGRDGRLLLHCFSGCSVTAILAALKLSRRDLFQGPPPSPAQLAAIEAERKVTEQRKRAERAADREAWDKVRKLQAICSELGERLMRHPDDDKIASLYQQNLARLRNEVDAPKGVA